MMREKVNCYNLDKSKQPHRVIPWIWLHCTVVPSSLLTYTHTHTHSYAILHTVSATIARDLLSNDFFSVFFFYFRNKLNSISCGTSNIRNCALYLFRLHNISQIQVVSFIQMKVKKALAMKLYSIIWEKNIFKSHCLTVYNININQNSNNKNKCKEIKVTAKVLKIVCL